MVVSQKNAAQWKPITFAVHLTNTRYVEGKRKYPRFNEARRSLSLLSLTLLAIALLQLLNVIARSYFPSATPVINLGSVVMPAAYFVYLARNYWLATRGQVLDGILTSVNLVKVVNRGRLLSFPTYWLKVDYEFKNPQGTLLAGKATSQRKDLQYGSRPSMGTPIKVVYLNDHYHEAV